MIKGGLKTKVYWVRASGYDTHNGQVETGNTTTGIHANLLKELSDAIFTFMTDITNMGLEERVMGMTFSEFGRRIKANGSVGTDHGAGNPMFIFGKYVNPTVLGANAIIPANASSNAVVPVQFDFKSIYQGILQGWFCVPAIDAATFLGTQSPENVTTSTCASTVLPIELLSFMVEKANQNDVHIEWITATEQSVASFEIERSVDGVRFYRIATKKAVGHSHIASRYEHLDKDVPLEKSKIWYYRVRIIEQDHAFSFTKTKSVTFEGLEKGISAEIFPNPSHSTSIHLRLKGSFKENSLTEITITDSFGRRLLELSDSGYKEGQQLDIELPNAVSGIYFLSIVNEHQIHTQRIVLYR